MKYKLDFNNISLYEPQFTSKWNKVSLYELAEWTNGKAFKNTDYTPDGYPIIKIAELNNGISSKTKFSENKSLDDKYLITKDDILFSWSGNPYTSINIYKFNYKIGWLNQHIFKVINNGELVEKNYLYYLLKYINPHFIKIASNKQTTGLGHVTIKDLKNMVVKIPNLKEQSSIVKILVNLDNKIELNDKTIEKFEELTKAYFKHWFEEFEFPDKNGNPYKTSGGKMIETEIGKIPEKWYVKKLNQLAQHKKTSFKPSLSSEDEVLHFSIPAFDNNQLPVLDRVIDIKSNKWILEDNCVLFSKMNPSNRRIWLSSVNNMYVNVASSEFVVLKSENSKKNSFVYNVCISERFNNFLISNTTGSTNSRQRVKPELAVNYRLPYNEDIVELYCEIAESYIEKIKILRSENNHLAQIRDTLLPKLMSGEIGIPDDIEVNEDELSI